MSKSHAKTQLRYRKGTTGGRGGRFAPESLRGVIERAGNAAASFFGGANWARAGGAYKGKGAKRGRKRSAATARKWGKGSWFR